MKEFAEKEKQRKSYEISRNVCSSYFKRFRERTAVQYIN